MAIPIGEYKQAVEALAQRMKAFCDRARIDIEKEWERNYIPGSKFANEVEALAQETNQEIDDKFIERFCHKAVMTIMLKFLFLRFAEDKKILEPYFRDEAIEKWQKEDRNVQEVIREAFENAREKFKGLYKTTVYDEFLPSKETLEIYLIDAVSDEPKSGVYKGKGSLNFATLDPQVVSAFYEKLFDRKKRKELGLFFTPPVIAEYLVEKAFEGQKITKDFLVLDPACGSGQILLAAYKKLKDIFIKQLEMTPSEVHKQILSHNLWGVDIEPFAVLLSKINLALQDLENVPEYINIIHGDSLLETSFDIPQIVLFKDIGKDQKQKLVQITVPLQGGKTITVWRNGKGRVLLKKPIEQTTLFELAERMKTEIFSESGIRTMKDLPKEFDMVVANPPYVFTREAGFSQEKKKLYSDTFETGIGKINLFSLFIEYGLKKLKNNNLFAFVLYDTILRASPYEPARAYILNNSKIVALVELGESAFEDTMGETIIMVLRKCLQCRDLLSNKVEITHNIKDSSRSFVEQAIFNENPGKIFTIFSNKSLYKIIKKIKEKGIEFSQIPKILIAGIQTKKDKKKYIAEQKLTTLYKKLLEGKDIGRYKINFRERYIIYDRKKLHVAQDEKIFLVPEKILIQRIHGGANPIVATIDRNQYYSFNSLNNLIITSKNFDNRYILALLNSSLINFYFSANFTNFAQLTVNISERFLNQLPIYPATPVKQKPFIEMADKMLGLNKKLQETKKSFKEFVEEKTKTKIPLREIEGLDFVNIKDSRAKLGDKSKISIHQEESAITVIINKKPIIKIVCQDGIPAEFLTKYLDGLRTDILRGKDGDLWIERILNTKISWDKKPILGKLLKEYKNLQSSTEQLKKEIAETDKKIDEMVYDLYGIIKEERKIIEEPSR